MDERCNLKPSEFSAEIRSAFRGMDDKAKISALNAALASGDGETIASLCRCPSLLSGIDQEQQERYIRNLQEAKCPDLLEAMADLDESISVAEAVSRTAQMMFDASYNHQQQREIDAAEAAAQQAEAALQETLS